MIVYYLMMLTMALFYLLLNRVIITYKGNCINNVAFLSVAWVLLSLLEGLRSFSVGTDTSAYVSLFKHPRSSLEGGFQFLISLVHKFSNNPTIFLLVCAFITNGLVLLAIYRMSDNVFLSVYFYVALYYYFISYNALRQYLAVAVLLNAFWYAKQKKWLKYAIMMLIAASLHTVAIVGLIYILIFWGNDEVVSKKKAILIVGGGIAATLSLDSLMELLFRIVPQYKIYVGSSYLTDAGGIQQPIVNTAILLAFVCLSPEKAKEKSPYVLPFLLAVILSFLQMKLFSAQRFLWCFDIFSIFLLPSVMLNNRLETKSKAIFNVGVIVAALLFMTYYLNYNYMRVGNYSVAV